MAKPFGRVQRVADFLRRELSSLIQQQLRDPRLGMISITDVEVSRDLAHARVFVTVLGCDTNEEAEESIEVLNNASGFLRTEMSRMLTMRVAPALKFIFDDSVQRGLEISSLIDKAINSDKQRQQGSIKDDETP